MLSTRPGVCRVVTAASRFVRGPKRCARPLGKPTALPRGYGREPFRPWAETVRSTTGQAHGLAFLVGASILRWLETASERGLEVKEQEPEPGF
jgi:hypothetical protein